MHAAGGCHLSSVRCHVACAAAPIPTLRRMLTLLRTLVRRIFTVLVALLLLFEEWGWVPLAALFARLARWPFWASLERRIASLPPWAALMVLLVPAVCLFPVKLLALYLLGSGQHLLGLGVLISAKLVGTAAVARLFQLTQPALMQLAWFARWYPRWTAWKDRILAQARQSAPWLAAQRVKAGVRDQLRRAKAQWRAWWRKPE